jgi:hypothetical protein
MGLVLRLAGDAVELQEDVDRHGAANIALR